MSLAGKKILVVEDEPVMVKLFRLNFEMRGCEVVAWDSSDGIVEQVLRQKPDLVIMDLIMPLKSGWTLLEELKGDGRTAGVPVVICSVMSKREDREKGMRMGAFEYITKPFDLNELVEVAERAVAAGAGAAGEHPEAGG